MTEKQIEKVKATIVKYKKALAADKRHWVNTMTDRGLVTSFLHNL
mgnify:CR=1 FL=1